MPPTAVPVPNAAPIRLNQLGNPEAPILVICDPPSQEVYQMGWVMAQQAMNTFGQAAGQAGLEASDFQFVTACPFIPAEDFATEGKQKKFASTHQAALREILDRSPARMVMMLGSLSLHQVYGAYGIKSAPTITKAQGKFSTHAETNKVLLPSFPPAYINRRPDLAGAFHGIFQSIVTLRRSAWDLRALTAMKLQGNYEWTFDLSELMASRPRAIVLDTETVGLYRVGSPTPARIITVQISSREGHSYVIPWDREWWERFRREGLMLGHDLPEMPADFEGRIHSQLRTLLGDPSVHVAGHNLKYDLHVLHSIGIEVANWSLESMQLAFSVDENMPDKSLDEVVRRFVPDMAGYADTFNRTYDKSRMDLIPPWELLAYAGGDTDACLRVTNLLTDIVRRDARQWNTFRRIQMPALRAFVRIERRGVMTDRQALRDLAELCRTTEARLFEELMSRVPTAVKRRHLSQDGGTENLKFSRAAFLVDVLFSRDGFNLTPVKFTPSTAKSLKPIPSASSKDHLPFFLTFNTPDGYPFVRNLIEYQKLAKLRSTYVGAEALGTGFWQYIRSDDAVHPSFFLHDTVTGRSTSKEPNAQNFPKRGQGVLADLVKGFRKIFKARPGYKYLECDLSQAELRLAAWMSGDPVMIDIYRRGGDLHTSTAAAVMGLTEEQFGQLTKAERKLARFQAKAVNFGFIYGMGAESFKDYAKVQYELDFTLEQAEEMRALFFRTYPSLENWHAAMRQFVREHGYVRSLHGALRHLGNIQSRDRGVRGECERQAINSPVQRFGSDIGIMAMARLMQGADSDIIAPIMFIHDALIVEVREDYYEQAKGWMKYTMESTPFQSWFGITPPIPILADVSGGDNLGEMEEFADVVSSRPPWMGESA